MNEHINNIVKYQMSQSANKSRQNTNTHKKSGKTKIVAVTINLSQNANTHRSVGGELTTQTPMCSRPQRKHTHRKTKHEKQTEVGRVQQTFCTFRHYFGYINKLNREQS